MKRFFLLSAASLSILSLIGCASLKGAPADKPVILLAAFGSSYESGRKNLEDLDKAYAAAFPEHEVYWALTASFIVKKLRKNGVNTLFERQTPLMTVEEAYEKFRREGRRNVAVQVVMVMVGSEFREVVNTPAKGLNVKYGYPLFFNPEDIQNTAAALSAEFGDPADTFTILTAHGNDHHPEFNAELIQMDDYLQENYRNVRVATVEGAPHFNDLKEEVLASELPKVKFIPLMLTFGDHMSNDVLGDEEDSWKVILRKESEGADGMASNPAIQEIYIGHTRRIVNQF